MKALIIAAGRGQRLDHLTKENPKPLIKLLGLSLIERVILTAKQAGIKEFIIVIGYLGNKIKLKLGNGEKYGIPHGDPNSHLAEPGRHREVHHPVQSHYSQEYQRGS